MDIFPTFTVFLDNRNFFSFSSGEAEGGRACGTRGFFWIMRVFIRLPQNGHCFWFQPGGME
jgi:hypothetical protein